MKFIERTDSVQRNNNKNIIPDRDKYKLTIDQKKEENLKRQTQQQAASMSINGE